MDRPFLDANVLFSAAYRTDAGLQHSWRLDDVRLVTTRYALEEARRNLDADAQIRRLDRLSQELDLVVPAPATYARPEGVRLPAKDWPILLAAPANAATHRITGDARHFGRCFDTRIAGVLIMRPATYLSRRG